MASDRDTLNDALDAFQLASDAEEDNRASALADMKLARLGGDEQWTIDGKNWAQARRVEGRPVITANRMPAFIRQVTNDIRINRPAIKVHPVDSGADIETAKVIDGLCRHIEYSSDADVAYDTASEHAVTGGFGFFRVDIDYAYADTFDKDLKIRRIANPFSVYGDPKSTAADSSDWNSSFVVDEMTLDDFAAQFRGAKKVSWETEGYRGLREPWRRGDNVLVAEWFTREEIDKPIVMCVGLDGSRQIMDAEAYQANADLFQAIGLRVVAERVAKAQKVTHRLMSGAEVLETNEWPGCYIPIIPVYGEEVNVEGKRYFRSLIADAKDSQRMFNVFRSSAVEMAGLQPKAPFIGPEEAFEADTDKWETANVKAYPYIAYKGAVPPQRVQNSGQPINEMAQALAMSDDMKSIMGLFDASLGQKSNETSGKAIMARQREGDVSTFHFGDNLTRAIRHCGRILIDLIPKVYTGPRVIRTLGYDGKAGSAVLGPRPQPGQPQPGQPDPRQEQQMQDGQAVSRIFDLTAGKYDVTVESGPSFTTRREEAAQAMTELIRSYPQAAPVVAPSLMKVMDWPGADEMATKLEQVGAAQMAESQTKAENQKLQMQMEGLKADKSAQLKDSETRAFDAETKRMQALGQAMVPPNPETPLDPAERAVKEADADLKRAQAEKLRAEAANANVDTRDRTLSADAVAAASQSHADMAGVLTQVMQANAAMAASISTSMERMARAAEADTVIEVGKDGKKRGRKVLMPAAPTLQ